VGTGWRRLRFSNEQLFGTDPLVIAAYADALRGPARTLLDGDPDLWARLRRQRRARIAYNRRRYEHVPATQGHGLSREGSMVAAAWP
jgi:hypothetical protein